MKTRALIFSAAILLGASTTYGSTAYLDRYPSKLKLKKLVEKGVRHLVIASDYDRRTGKRNRVGYPSRKHASTLSTRDDLRVDLSIDASGYPSKRAVAYLNKLGGNVKLNVDIENCLSSSREKSRLLKITRSAKVVVECHSDRMAARARKYANEITTQNKDVTVTVRRAY